MADLERFWRKTPLGPLGVNWLNSTIWRLGNNSSAVHTFAELDILNNLFPSTRISIHHFYHAFGIKRILCSKLECSTRSKVALESLEKRDFLQWKSLVIFQLLAEHLADEIGDFRSFTFMELACVWKCL
jgi:hypothetical protein